MGIKHNMFEYQKAVNNLRACKSDLSEKQIIEKAQKISDSWGLTVMNVVRIWTRYVMEGKSPPWEEREIEIKIKKLKIAKVTFSDSKPITGTAIVKGNKIEISFNEDVNIKSGEDLIVEYEITTDEDSK
jgi:hypothetical protein